MARAWARSGGTLGFKSNDCRWRGMLGGVARRLSFRNSQASAMLPTPMALRARNRRREQNPMAPSTDCGITFTKRGQDIDEPDDKGNSKRVQLGGFQTGDEGPPERGIHIHSAVAGGYRVAKLRNEFRAPGASVVLGWLAPIILFLKLWLMLGGSLKAGRKCPDRN